MCCNDSYIVHYAPVCARSRTRFYMIQASQFGEIIFCAVPYLESGVQDDFCIQLLPRRIKGRIDTSETLLPPASILTYGDISTIVAGVNATRANATPFFYRIALNLLKDTIYCPNGHQDPLHCAKLLQMSFGWEAVKNTRPTAPYPPIVAGGVAKGPRFAMIGRHVACRYVLTRN
ncbi:MAG: hypothetical protein BECKG1743D_GA0114223_101071 [Candidatus Kentron sp. G]|nr:MAG: hypothetical protein BECKG1743E_GA0114224_101178 [Candidatus Kentron sp. G]VFM99188.1 MAG: hypothetical protein BECKG1743D_GA0114223_101071 [Candidatus Kentron sp. G]